MLPMTFSFADSEIARIRRDGHVIAVVFAAAQVRRTAAGGRVEDGHALGLALRLTGVTFCSPLDGACIGRLAGGGLSAGGPPRSSIVLPALPFEWSSPTQVALDFGLGTAWSAQALKAAFLWTDEPRFVESLAC